MLWPTWAAASFVDTDLRCFMELEGMNVDRRQSGTPVLMRLKRMAMPK